MFEGKQYYYFIEYREVNKNKTLYSLASEKSGGVKYLVGADIRNLFWCTLPLPETLQIIIIKSNNDHVLSCTLKPTAQNMIYHKDGIVTL